jgi:hypothetical protein
LPSIDTIPEFFLFRVAKKSQLDRMVDTVSSGQHKRPAAETVAHLKAKLRQSVAENEELDNSSGGAALYGHYDTSMKTNGHVAANGDAKVNGETGGASIGVSNENSTFNLTKVVNGVNGAHSVAEETNNGQSPVDAAQKNLDPTTKAWVPSKPFQEVRQQFPRSNYWT